MRNFHYWTILIVAVLVAWTVPCSSATYTRLTFMPTCNQVCPAWSPDGTTIAFRSDSLPTGIWIIPASGGAPVHLSLAPEFGSGPAWSPDGSQIAYSQGGEIWVGPSTGGAAVQLTSMEPGAMQYHPTWSPDGTTIAFTSFDSGLERGYIWRVSALGGTPVAIKGSALNPSWSPDGSRIAYERFSQGNYIAHMAVDGSDERLITGGTDDFQPAWSPDGNWIAFCSNRTGTTSLDIWLASSSGGTLVRITDNPGDENWPAWSPNGSKIVFVADWTGNNELWVASDLFGQTSVQSTTWGKIKTLFR